MNNELQFLITVRYPEWGDDNGGKYPAFGLKYLFKTPVIAVPDFENEMDAVMWSEDKVVRDRFKQWWRKHIGHGETFNGDILFVEPSNFVICDGKPMGIL